jgi:hypothetical protein
LRAKEKSQRWEEELTSGPHLSANERKKKKKKGRGRAGLAARLNGSRGLTRLKEKLGRTGKKRKGMENERWASGRLGRASCWAAGWKRRKGEGRGGWGFVFFLFFQTFEIELFSNLSRFLKHFKASHQQKKHHAFKS